jgi:hypothetical protein
MPLNGFDFSPRRNVVQAAHDLLRGQLGIEVQPAECLTSDANGHGLAKPSDFVVALAEARAPSRTGRASDRCA